MEYNLKAIVKGTAHFSHYFDGDLWYKMYYHEDITSSAHLYFDFPVPISDIGNATFNREEKGLLMMRYVRKQLKALAAIELEKHKEETTTLDTFLEWVEHLGQSSYSQYRNSLVLDFDQSKLNIVAYATTPVVMYKGDSYGMMSRRVDSLEDIYKQLEGKNIILYMILKRNNEMVIRYSEVPK